MKLKFLGAVGTVTGSKYLLTHEDKKILVDCGLFQGYKEWRLRNWEPLPVNPAELSAVLLTHAHLDHSGYIPLLVKNGFTGKIYCTPATYDLCAILLPDSGYLQEEDARRANKYRYSKHDPALPLYTLEDAQASLKQFKVVEFNQSQQDILPGTKITWHHAGHILGAATIDIEWDGKHLVFSGDVGRLEDPLLKAPEPLKSADYLVIESTYGDRLHPREDVLSRLAELITSTAKKSGTMVIASFAVGRAQSLLYDLYQLKMAHRIPNIPIFLDSPMSIDATEIFERYPNEHRLTVGMAKAVCNVATYIHTPEESKEMASKPMPKIILSASGMATGGRILHHIKQFGTDSRNTILFAGYQAGGTRGARMVNGEKEIKIHGEMVPISARVEQISSLSAHADYSEILMWLKSLEKPPRGIFVTHGEPDGALGLQQHLQETLGWSSVIPEYLEEVDLA